MPNLYCDCGAANYYDTTKPHSCRKCGNSLGQPVTSIVASTPAPPPKKKAIVVPQARSQQPTGQQFGDDDEEDFDPNPFQSGAADKSQFEGVFDDVEIIGGGVGKIDLRDAVGNQPRVANKKHVPRNIAEANSQRVLDEMQPRKPGDSTEVKK